MPPYSADPAFVLCRVVSLFPFLRSRKYIGFYRDQASLSANLASDLARRSPCPRKGPRDVIRAIGFRKFAKRQSCPEALLYFLALRAAENSGA